MWNGRQMGVFFSCFNEEDGVLPKGRRFRFHEK